MACSSSEGSLITLLYNAAAKTILPAIIDIKQWIRPLDRYFVNIPEPPEPLDYLHLSLIQYGLHIAFPAHIRRKIVPMMTHKIGRAWWYGDAPISVHQDRYSLQRILTPIILERLDQQKIGAPNITSLSVSSEDKLAQLGVQTFVNELHKQSYISIQSHARRTSLEISIIECPFCLGRSQLCQVFLGVFEGLLEWLHGALPISVEAPKLRLNEDISTGHRIVLDHIPFRSKAATPQQFISTRQENEALKQQQRRLEQERDQARRQWGLWEQQAMMLQRQQQGYKTMIAQLVTHVRELQQSVSHLQDLLQQAEDAIER
jgi:hypothetical protein